MARSQIAVRGVAVVVAGALSACSDPSGLYSPYKVEWHESCKVAAFNIPGKVASLVPRKSQVSNLQLGECSARRVDGQIWYVVGWYQTEQMKGDGVGPARFVALMLEDSDSSNLYVERYGTQYLLCSIAIDGVDLTGDIHLRAC